MKFRRPNQHFQIVAHRGLPEDYPENTIIAYRHALMLHIDMLEIDVHYTKDKELVVILSIVRQMVKVSFLILL